MQLIKDAVAKGKTNFICIGEAGCGKSEIALNLAKYLTICAETDKTVHLFDMDMTKPLFRSRDLLDSPELSDVVIHYEEQFYDAPTLVGGVRELLTDPNSIVVMDVGGDDIGARAIGGFMANVPKNSLCIMYVLNYFRPFCQDLDHINQFVAEILHASHLEIGDIHFIHNPNVGVSTTVSELEKGLQNMKTMLSPHAKIDMICVEENLVREVKDRISANSMMPIHLYLTYEWLKA